MNKIDYQNWKNVPEICQERKKKKKNYCSPKRRREQTKLSFCQQGIGFLDLIVTASTIFHKYLRSYPMSNLKQILCIGQNMQDFQSSVGQWQNSTVLLVLNHVNHSILFRLENAGWCLDLGINWFTSHNRHCTII